MDTRESEIDLQGGGESRIPGEDTPLEVSPDPAAPAAADETIILEPPAFLESSEQGYIGAHAISPAHPNILLMHASVGSGHRSAAEAIANALRLQIAAGDKVSPQQPDDIYVEVLDSLRFARWYIDGNKTASGFVGPTRPFYDVTWRYGFTGFLLWNGGGQWLRVMFPMFKRWVAINKPAAIVCTHITAANIAVGARMMTRQTFPIVCVPTDYEVEGQWPHLYADLFCCASEYMAETLRARRVPEHRIQVTGIPVNPQFTLEFDPVAARKKWNLPEGKKIALVLAGAKLPKPYQRFRETLFDLMPRIHKLPDIEFVFVAGSDEEYVDRLKQQIDVENLTNVRVLGYVTEMAELMSACDFAICKAGGLTVTECLCAKTPMILVGKAYGQEKVNVRLLTSLGAALHVQTARELYETLNYVSRSEYGLKSLVMNGAMIRRPNAAADIAHSTLELAYGSMTQAGLEERMAHHFFLGVGGPPAHTR